jgi:hypothetical protein
VELLSDPHLRNEVGRHDHDVASVFLNHPRRLLQAFWRAGGDGNLGPLSG